MYNGIAWGPPTDAHQGIARKTCTRVWWARLDSLIVVMNCGHSWCLRGSCVSCCQVISLARCILILISMTPSDMGQAYSLCSNIVMELHYCWYENYGWCWLLCSQVMLLIKVEWSYLCMTSIGCKLIMLINYEAFPCLVSWILGHDG
jgi:hypothetical protein